MSIPAILDGIRSGNVFVDGEGSRDRLLEMHATAGQASAEMDETLRRKGTILISAHLVGVHGADARLVVDGRPIGRSQMVRSDDADLTFALKARAGMRWFAIAVERDPGHPLLIGNPVYLVR